MPWFQAPSGNWFLSQELLDDDLYSSKLVQGDNVRRKPETAPTGGPVNTPDFPKMQAASIAPPPPPRPYPQPVYSESKTIFSDGRVEETKTTYPYRS